MEPLDNQPTRKRCSECWGEKFTEGGPYVPTPETMQRVSPDLCARGPGWSWCASFQKFSLHLKEPCICDWLRWS